MRKLVMLLMLCSAALFLAPATAWALGGFGGGGFGGGSGYSGGSNYRNFKLGQNKTYSWRRMDLNAARKLEKPILLYIYDNRMKQQNNTARYFESNLFPKTKVVEALSGFTYVMLPSSSKGWPQPFFNLAKKGALAMILYANGTPVGYWYKGHRPRETDFIFAAQAAKARNAQVVEQMKKHPPKKFQQAPPPAQAPVAAQEPQEKKPEKPGLVPGLGGNDEKKGKKKAHKRTKKNVEEEEEE